MALRRRSSWAISAIRSDSSSFRIWVIVLLEELSFKQNNACLPWRQSEASARWPQSVSLRHGLHHVAQLDGNLTGYPVSISSRISVGSDVFSAITYFTQNISLENSPPDATWASGRGVIPLFALNRTSMLS